jgi:hypothetical protein
VPVLEAEAEKTETLLERLATDKEPDLEEAVSAAIGNVTFRRQLLDGLLSKQDTLRYNCVRVLQEASTSSPASLYGCWDELVPLLDSPNAYHRASAVQLLANLAKADGGRKLVSIFDRYFQRLDDDRIVPARYLVRSVSTIVEACPRLIPRIAAKLLAVDGTRHSSGRKDLLKGDVVEAFDSFFDRVPDPASVLSFVEAQLNSGSPRTRKAASAFLDRHGA